MPRSGPAARAGSTLCAALASLALTACGSDESPHEQAAAPAPATADFPKPEGRSLEQMLTANEPTDEYVVSPSGGVLTPDSKRFGFGVFTVGGEQVTDADVAIYAQPVDAKKALGPFPAKIESLATDPEFRAREAAGSELESQVVYVTEIPFDQEGEWRFAAMIRTGSEVVWTRIPSLVSKPYKEIPAEGEPAPEVHTPTAQEVGSDLASIDTRVPPSSMHEDDLADVLGREPVVLLFATPALCQTRVCGPVVDVAEQVKAEAGDDAAFIHMEIYEDNRPPKLRPQVERYGLPTEPWLFVIGRDGEVSTRIEGAFSVAELERAVREVTG